VKTQIVVICFYSQFCLKKIKTYPVSKQLSIHLENTEKKYLKKNEAKWMPINKAVRFPPA